MATQANFIWPQGEDLSVELIYKEGPVGSEVVVPLTTTDYAVRMDIVSSDGTRLYTFNSESIADVDPLAPSAQADAVVEGVLSDGSGGTPNITIIVDRALTLPGGEVYEHYSGNMTDTLFYDVFLRNKTISPVGNTSTTGKQVKILTGNITVEKSYTLWL